jgi:hypothetical protein
VIFLILLISNVSLFLYLRNCRYYSPVFATTVFVIILYIKSPGTKRQWVVLSLAGVFLATSQYLNYAALVFALLLDYAIFRRGEFKLSARKWGLLLASQIVMVGPILALFNPVGKNVVSSENADWLAEKLQLLWWNFRDLDACQFGALPILFLGFLFISQGPYREAIKRLGLGGFFYITAIVILSPQPVRATSVADVRYLVPLIPVLISLESLILCSVFSSKPKLAVVCAGFLAMSNLFSLQYVTHRTVHFPFYSFVKELLDSPHDPYSTTASWVAENIPPHSSIWVLPDHMAYPLMFHAPKSIYAWQLDASQRKEAQFSGLPAIHFRGQKQPDYIIVFGPMVVPLREMLEQWKNEGVQYANIVMMNVFWKDLYRPELFWRSFVTIPVTDKQTQGVYVFKRLEVNAGGSGAKIIGKLASLKE